MAVCGSALKGGPYVIPRKRPPRLLTFPGMLVHFAAQAAIIATIAALWKISNDNRGIITVPDTPGSTFNQGGFQGAHFWTAAILWTALPAWLMNLYSSYWAAMLDELKSCQATVDLHRPALLLKQRRGPLSVVRARSGLPGNDNQNARSVKQTILLDYGRGIPIWDSIQAIRNRHFLLAACMAQRAALWAASGFAAAALSAAVVPVTSPSEFRTSQKFDGYENGFIKFSNLTLRPALDIVSSNINFGGSRYQWTTDTHSFLPFQATRQGLTGNMSAATEAHSAGLDCAVYSAEDLVRNGFVTYKSNSDSFELLYTIRDRGCTATFPQIVMEKIPGVSRTWVTTKCSSTTGRYRLGLISGRFDKDAPFKLGDFTLLSCIPTFWRHSARVTVATYLNDTGEVLGADITSRTQFDPPFANSLLGFIPFYAISEPTTLFDMDDTGSITATHASKTRPSDRLNSQQVLDSFQKTFGAIYATFVSMNLYAPVADAISTGGITVPENRLFVVQSAAIIVLTIVAVALCTTLVLTAWVLARRDVLATHVDGIFGHALLLSNNQGLAAYIGAVDTSIKVQEPGCFANVGNYDRVKQAANDPDARLSEWKCWLDGAGVLRIERPGGMTPPEFRLADSSTASMDNPGSVELHNITPTAAP